MVRGGQELEVVQEDQHFSAHYQVSSSRYGGTQRTVFVLSLRHIWELLGNMVALVGGGGPFPTAPLFRSPSKSGTT